MAGWGTFSYRWDEYKMPIHKTIGICYECDNIVPVEVLPNEEKNPLDISEGTLKAFLEERQSNARCLHCGGVDFDVIPNVERDKEREKLGLPYRTGMRHRNCVDVKRRAYFRHQLP